MRQQYTKAQEKNKNFKIYDDNNLPETIKKPNNLGTFKHYVKSLNLTQ